MSRKVLLTVVCLLLMVGCGDPPPRQGYVRDKKFVPAHWEDGYATDYLPEMRCHQVSEYNSSTKSYQYHQQCGTEMVPHQRYVAHYSFSPDSWRLYLEDCKASKCHRGWLKVDQTEYHDYRVGEHYPDAR